MIDFRGSSEHKTVVTWQGEHCQATVDIGTVDAASAVQLRLLLQKMDGYPDIRMEFNEYKGATVQWTHELYNTRGGVFRDVLVEAALDRENFLSWDITAYNHHCAIMETAEEAKAA
jgi:hypothetical protein